jgi:hypothetical protein
MISVSQTSLLANPFWLRKISTDPHVLADVNTDCPEDMYLLLTIYYISELISYNYQYIPFPWG